MTIDRQADVNRVGRGMAIRRAEERVDLVNDACVSLHAAL